MMLSAAVAMLLFAPGVADASCAPLEGTRAQRLAEIAAGNSAYDVAFVGRLVERRDAVEKRGGTYTPHLFQVVKSFGAAVGARTVVLVPGGCINNSCVAGGEDASYSMHGLQLVLADQRRHVGTVSASACSMQDPSDRTRPRTCSPNRMSCRSPACHCFPV